MKPFILLYLFLLISFASLAQQKNYKPFEHPVIQKLEKKSEDVIGFENKQNKSWLIAAVLEKNSKTIYLVNYIGEVIHHHPLSDSTYEKILNKKVDPFDYHLINISSALELTDAAIAKLRFPDLSIHYDGIDNFEEEVGLLLSQNTIKAENNIAENLSLLLELRQHYLNILVQSLARIPELLKEDTTITSHLKSGLAGKVIVHNNPDSATTAVFYNNNIFSPLQKAVLNIKNAEILFYSGDEKITDSISINPKKSKFIFDNNLDVFDLYKDYQLYRLLQADSIYSDFSSYLLKDRQKKNSIIPALLTVNEEEPEKLWYAIQQNMQINLEKLYLFYSADIHRFEQYHKYIIRTAAYIKTAVYYESSNWLIIGTRVRYYRGNKHYELTDHRGNVMAVISDKKLPVDANEDGTIDYYAADIVKATDYAPFGMGLVDRSFNVESYRYGFNGKEHDQETSFQDYGFRIYNPGLGRFLSVDPLMKSFPWYTPYQFAGNKPIESIDIDGAEEMHFTWIKDENGKAFLHNLGEKDIITRAIVGYKSGNSLFNDAPVAQYETRINHKKVYILHTIHRAPRDNYGGLHPTQPQVWIDYPMSWEYDSYEDMVQGRNGRRSASNYMSMTLDRYGAAIKSENAAMPAGGFGNLKPQKHGRNLVTPLVDDVAREGAAKTGIQLTKKTFGHTFTTHGDDMTNFLINRAKGSGKPQGQFLDNQKAAQFILENIKKTANGAVDIPIPKGFPARIIMPDGTFKVPTHIKLVPGGGGVKTAFPLIP